MENEKKIHPACALCGGACCKSIIVSLDSFEAGHDAARWASYHGRLIPERNAVEIEARCCQLTPAGLCRIEATKPKMCRDMVVGSKECRDAVRRHSTFERVLMIFGAIEEEAERARKSGS